MLDPHDLLFDVHPDLAKVLRAAAQTPQEFQVVCGLRSLASQRLAVATGHSETLHSRHLPVAHYGGVSCAVDVVCLDAGGRPSWTAQGVNGGAYGAAAAQVLAAATGAGIDVQWGGAPVGAWQDGQASHYRDWGHFQLDPATYPPDP
jgi:peptidoglycan L-alanyl-D-glutamate endopeptidase CwlK